jgi:hemolysin activation/secretion protein
MLWLIAVPGYAQVIVVPENRPSERQIELPPLNPDKDQIEFQLPPVQAPPSPEISKAQRIRVKKFVFEGNTVISDKDIQAITERYFKAPYSGWVTSNDLQQIRLDVTRLFIQNNFLNSGVVLPDQKVTDGVIHFQVIEGRLSEIKISTIGRLKKSYVAKYFEGYEDQVLNTAEIQQKLFLLQMDPHIKRIKANLVPSKKLGLAKLLVEVEEEPPAKFSWSVNNHRPPGVGAETGELRYSNINLSGIGDSVYSEITISEGAKSFEADYRLPINPRTMNVLVGYNHYRSRIIEEPFDKLDIKSELQSLNAGFDYFFLKTSDRSYKTTFLLEFRQSKDQLGGEPFSFTSSSENGKTKLTVARLSQSWFTRYLKDTIALQYTLNTGMDWFNASVSSEEPDGLFYSFITQFLWSHQVQPRTSEILLRSNMQLASNPLFSMEQYSLGGVNSVRGYRENQFVRDSGWMTSVEYRHKAWHSMNGRQSVTVSVFIDHGQAKNKNETDDVPHTLSSTGLGLSWKNKDLYFADIYWAKRLREIDSSPEYNLQDSGLHFELSGTF